MITIEKTLKVSTKLPLSTSILLNIIHTRNVISDTFLEMIKPYGISEEQFNVLRILKGQKGNPINMSTIQERMLSKNSNTTRLIDKLLIKDLVTRNVNPKNRRKVEITITNKGLELLTLLNPQVIIHHDHFFRHLTPEEQKQLKALLEKIRN